ncbi:MAG: hypothetical protein JWR16_2928 [Nevskia sp.]|nr:hypothetical protein [Nevskia sp.]
MAIDRRHLGYTLPTFDVTVEPERLAEFAAAIGADAGSGLAPPTFMKAIEGEHGSSRAILEALNVDLRRVLHAEQQFDYLVPIVAGERLSVSRSVTDLYEKKNGVMEFIVIESVISKQDGSIAGRSRQVVLVRHPVTATAA